LAKTVRAQKKSPFHGALHLNPTRRRSPLKNRLARSIHLIWDRDHAHNESHTNHSLQLKNQQLAGDFRCIAENFELCLEGSRFMCVDGGIITDIECVSGASQPAKLASYIALDESNRRANLMETLCRDIQLLVVASLADDAAARLAFLTKQSGLLAYLLGGGPPERVALVDIQAIVIEDNLWAMAKLDYRLAGKEWVLPLNREDGRWVANQRWDQKAYRDIGNIIENEDFFRPVDELRRHNAELDDRGQPATRQGSESR